MAGSAGFAISITAKDQASGTLDSLNKRLAKLSAPADRFNKSLTKFSDVSGLSRVTESMRGLGKSAADAFVGLDQTGSRLASITSVASIAGMVALERHWADFGNTTKNVAYRLNMPTEKLGSLRVAMQLAGGSATDLDSGLAGLDEKLRGAAFGKDSGAIQLLTGLHIGFGDAVHGARTAGDALGDVADSLVGRTPGAQHNILESLGLGDGFLPLLKNGRKGLEDFQKQAGQTGAVPTGSMIENASKLDLAWVRVEKDLEGVWNHMADDYAGPVTKILSWSSNLIESNSKLIQSYAETGSAIVGVFSVLKAAKPAAWMLRALGLGVLVDVAPLAAPLALSGDTPQPDEGRADAWNAGPAAWAAWKEKHPGISTWLYELGAGTPGGGAASGPTLPGAPGNSPRLPRGLRNNNPLNLSYLPGQGALGSDGRFGVYGTMEEGIAAEARQFARYTETGSDTLRKVITRWAPPSDNDTEGYLGSVSRALGMDPNQQIDLHDPVLSSRLIHTMSKLENGRAVPMDTVQSGVGLATQNGHVQVDVHLHGATAGTSARVTTSGPVTAPPPRIETPMPMN